MNTFRNVLLGTAAVGLTAMAISPANAAETEKTFKVSGHVNRVLAITDDGDGSYVDFADNALSGSRFRMIGESKGGGITIGARIEFGLTTNQGSNQSSQAASTAPGSSNGILHRNAFVYVSSKKYGKLALGLQSTATDGTAEIDLSGTGAANYNTGGSPVGNYYFLKTGEKGGQDSSATGNINAASTANPKISSVFNGIDGDSRRDAIRYTSPSFKGFKLDVSLAEGVTADGAIKYSGKFFNTKISAALGYVNTAARSNNGWSTTGTISALHASGLNATVSMGRADKAGDSRQTMQNLFVKLGYQLKVFGAGRTSLSASWMRTDNANFDTAARGSFRGTKWGVEAVQKLDGYSTELIAAFSKMELDKPGTTYQDISAGWVGARVKF